MSRRKNNPDALADLDRMLSIHTRFEVARICEDRRMFQVTGTILLGEKQIGTMQGYYLRSHSTEELLDEADTESQEVLDMISWFLSANNVDSTDDIATVAKYGIVASVLWITRMKIAPAHRGQRYSYKVFRDAIELFAKEEAALVLVYPKGPDDTATAKLREHCERFGFQACGDTGVYYHHGQLFSPEESWLGQLEQT